jgi:hypothetical protein
MPSGERQTKEYAGAGYEEDIMEGEFLSSDGPMWIRDHK